jgi:hypothetical protein
MKRLLALTIATLWICCAHAQGTFIFSNRVTAAGVDAPVLDVGNATRVDGANFLAAIFLNGQQLGAAAPFRTGTGAGYWNPGGDSVRVVAGHFSGDIVTGFTVEVWDSTKGTTARAACAAGGKAASSITFSITLGGPRIDPAQPPDLPGVMLNFHSLSLEHSICVPEPSAIALGFLGAFVLAARRRRK